MKKGHQDGIDETSLKEIDLRVLAGPRWLSKTTGANGRHFKTKLKLRFS
jgi:hypothetical protein